MHGLRITAALGISLGMMVSAHASQTGVAPLGRGENVATQVQRWHDAQHATCAFARVVEHGPYTDEGEQAQVWTIEACRGALYHYKVKLVTFSPGGAPSVMVTEFEPAPGAHVPGTEGEDQVAANAPKDTPYRVAEDARTTMDAMLAPYIAQGQATWPEAKQRYRAGLPDGHILFVTMRLEEDTQFEVAFIRVDRVDGTRIQGRIASQLRLKHHHQGDPIELHDDAVLDWTISRPDGSEEGNFVGKFIDTLQGS